MNIDRVKKILSEKNIDAIYVSDKYNLRYITGFTGSNGYAVITKEKGLFLTDFRYIEQANEQVTINGFQVINMGKKYSNTLDEIFRKECITKLGIEDNDIKLSEYKKMVSDYSYLEFVEIGNILSGLRAVKNIDEIENIKMAAKIADIAFEKIIKEIKAGMTEREIAARLEYYMKMEGAEDRSFETIVASGYRSAMPHGVASSKKIAKEEFIKFDFGCYYNGYTSDITRTVYFGSNITEKHLDIYDTVFKGQQLGVSLVKDGAKAAEVDKTVRQYIDSRGYGENFGHGLGHSIGLEVHEEPSLSPRAGETLLAENMVLTVEPGVYIEGFGGVRIEDDVIVKKNGCEIINKTTKELIIIK